MRSEMSLGVSSKKSNALEDSKTAKRIFKMVYTMYRTKWKI